MQKTKRLPKTQKEKKFAIEYAKTGNATEAAWRVYDCKDRASAGSIGTENLQKLAIDDYLNIYGVTDEKLVAVISDGLSATRLGSVDEPDHRVRFWFLQTVLKIKGYMNKSSRKTVVPFTQWVKELEREQVVSAHL